MSTFHHVRGVLSTDGVALDQVATAVGTPCYVYSTATIERHARVFAEALAGLDDPLIAYAVKANPNAAVLATLARCGLAGVTGVEVVGAGEVRAGLAGPETERRVAEALLRAAAFAFGWHADPAAGADTAPDEVSFGRGRA